MDLKEMASSTNRCITGTTVMLFSSSSNAAGSLIRTRKNKKFKEGP
jgi:hypothetical protein